MAYRKYRKKRKSYYSFRYQKPKYYFSDKGIDVKSDSINISEFLIQEFFTTDNKTLSKILQLYTNEHGVRATQYLQRKYHEWKNANFHLTDMIRERILWIVPRCLNSEKQFYLLKHEVFSQVEEMALSINKSRYSRWSNIDEPFKQAETNINNLSEFRFNWFTSRDVFTTEQLSEFRIILKYILLVKLRESYLSVCNDLKLINNAKLKFTKAKYQFNYVIDFLSSEIDINSASVNNLNIQVPSLSLNSKFRTVAKEFLANEMRKIRFTNIKSEMNGKIALNDLQLVYNQYESLSNSDMKGEINSNLEGEGGILKISLDVLSIKGLKSGILMSSIRILSILIGYLTFYAIAMSYNNGFISLLWVVAFFGAFAAIGQLIEDFSNITQSLKDLKNYGR